MHLNRLPLLFGTVAIFVVCSAASAQDRLVLLDGKTIDATIDAIDVQGAITGENVPQGVTVDGLRRVETPASVTEVESQITAQLLGGSRLGLSKFTIDNSQKCHLISAAAGELTLPIDAMRAVRFPPCRGQWRCSAAPGTRD